VAKPGRWPGGPAGADEPEEWSGTPAQPGEAEYRRPTPGQMRDNGPDGISLPAQRGRGRTGPAGVLGRDGMLAWEGDSGPSGV
jgi:hypothetical protein